MRIFILPFFVVSFFVIQPHLLLALNHDATEESVLRDTEFHHRLDDGLSLLINEKNYEGAVESFEAALAIKPKDPTARKALRLAKSKLKGPKKKYIQRMPPRERSVQKAPEPEAEPEVAVSTETSSGWVTFDPPEPKAGSPEIPKNLKETKAEEIEERYHNGVLALVEENYSKAIKEMEWILSVDPDNLKAKKALSRAYSLRE